MIENTEPQAVAECPEKANAATPANFVPDYNSIANVAAFLFQNGTIPPWTLNPNGQPAPHIDIEPAIMEEGKLPQPPSALIEGVLPEKGKMVLTGAPKTWKSFLVVQLGVSIATGTAWLGVPCKLGKVLYVNLEIDRAQFMRRLFDIAQGLGVDTGLVEQNFQVAHGIDAGLPIDQLVSAILANDKAEGSSLVIIDPVYKAFSGSENDQEDMREFCSHLDRLTHKLGSAVLAVHHQSKGFQGHKDMADRGSGSGVLSRDVDALVDVCRIEGEGNAMRATFLLRGYPEPDPIEYTFEHPICVRDTEGKLATARYTNPHGTSHQNDQRLKKLALIENVCETLLQGRTKIDRKEIEEELGMKGKTISKYLEDSKHFVAKSGDNFCHVMRRP